MTDLEERLKIHGIGWYRSVAKDIEKSDSDPYVYVRQKPYWAGGKNDVFVIDGKKDVRQIAFDVTQCRAETLRKAVISGKITDVNAEVLNNFCHNGYLTRRGLFAKYSNDEIEKMGKIGMSHFLLDKSGKASHEYRKWIRK